MATEFTAFLAVRDVWRQFAENVKIQLVMRAEVLVVRLGTAFIVSILSVERFYSACWANDFKAFGWYPDRLAGSLSLFVGDPTQ